MSTDPEAKLFYGYIQPESDKELYRKIDFSRSNDTTPWRETHTKRAHGCIGSIYGYEGGLGFFLAVEESLHKAEWDDVMPLDIRDLGVKQLERPWNDMLRQAAEHFGLDVTGVEPGWYLVSLYY